MTDDDRQADLGEFGPGDETPDFQDLVAFVNELAENQQTLTDHIGEVAEAFETHVTNDGDDNSDPDSDDGDGPDSDSAVSREGTPSRGFQ